MTKDLIILGFHYLVTIFINENISIFVHYKYCQMQKYEAMENQTFVRKRTEIYAIYKILDLYAVDIRPRFSKRITRP